MLQNGASTEQGKVLVSDHIPKVKVSRMQLMCSRTEPIPLSS